MTTPLTQKDSQPSKARKEQTPRAQGSPASGELRDNEGRSIKDIQEWEQLSHDADDPTMIVSPRGQQQEWTPETVWARITEVLESGGDNEDATAIISAALADECQRREQAERELGMQGKPSNETEQLRLQLLSALAAIEKLPERYAEHLSAAATAGELGDVDEKYQVDLLRSVISDIDLSAMHKHDAEVREPLVGCLRRLINELPTRRDWLDPDLEKFARALLRENDALAKIKDQ